MISIYEGSVGSGKSYHALLEGLKKCTSLRSNRWVIANFPLKEQFCKPKEIERWHFWDDITPEKLILFAIEKEFAGIEGACLLIIDEAGILFNSRDWMIKSGDRKKWVSFFSQSRKFGYDVILVAQSDRMIDRQIRDLAEYVVRHFNMRMYWFLSWLPFRLHMAVFRWYGTRIKGTMDPFIVRKGVYKKYDTMRIFNLDEVKEQIKVMYGRVIPAAVAKYVSMLEENIAEEKKKIKNTEAVKNEKSTVRSIFDKVDASETENQDCSNENEEVC